MCRIVGISGFEERGPQIKDLVSKMTEELKHGGPDDGGLYIDDIYPVALGHRRLSILDLSQSGHQPMSTWDKTIWVSYNGEIYNFIEIREELKSSGYKFKSNTDTEVIVNAYHKWGEDSFKKFNGMFSFCLFDKRKALIYLVRDHAGIKPLYYSFHKKALIFASETKSFKTFDNNWVENPDWKIYLLTFGHIPEPFTTLKEVFMLPKGSFLKFNLKDKSYDIQKYFELTFKQDITTAKEAERRIKETFEDSIKRHLISDAPIGVFLSGGIDSSLVALISSQYKEQDLRTLSVVFNEKDFTEESYQNVILSKINSRHQSYLVTENDFMMNIENIFRGMDQPTTDGINSYFISRCAKEEGLKAVLSGLGGDELFGGYPSFSRIDKVWYVKHLKSGFRKYFNAFEYAPGDKLKKFSFLALNDPISFYLFFRGFFSVGKVSKILNISRNEVVKALQKLVDQRYMVFNKKDFVSLLESDMYMKNQLLKDTDFMSMWQSIEVRVPFLDKEFLKTVFSISPKLKFFNGPPKPLLVNTFKDILPSEVIYRKKQGFSFPFQKWMRNNVHELKSTIEDINNPTISKIIHDFQNNKLHWSRFWSLVVLGQKS